MAFFLAWAVGEAIVIYRTSFAKNSQGGPPWPGQLAMSSGVFAILAVIAEAGPGAKKLAITMSWGFNIAAFMNLTQTKTGQVVWKTTNKVTLPAPAGQGWWKTLTTTKLIPDTQVLPSEGGGTAAPGGTGSLGGVGAAAAAQAGAAAQKLGQQATTKQAAATPKYSVLPPGTANPTGQAQLA